MTNVEFKMHLKSILNAIDEGQDISDIYDYIISLFMQIDKEGRN